MNKGYEKREYAIVDDIEYLIDRDDRTAWIHDAHTGGSVEYTLPESVMIDGETYVCCSVEIGAYWNMPDLETLNIPDCYKYIDHDSFKGCKRLHTVHIGAGMEKYTGWAFGDSPIQTITISPDNPYIKMSDDGKMILSRDGKKIYGIVGRDFLKELIVPEGVEEILEIAISCCNIGNIHLPSTLKKIGINGIFECKGLGHLTIPEGVTRIGLQGLSWLDNLITLELPSTLDKYSSAMLAGNERLACLVIHGDRVLEIEDSGRDDPFADIPVGRITLVVPRNLVNDYRKHPDWGRFLDIKPIPVFV